QDRPWPKKYQINLLQNQEGNGIGLAKARSKGLVKPGWNQMKLTVRGETAQMEINGKPAWKTDGVAVSNGYIGIQVEVPGGGQFEFRNLFVTELAHESIFDEKSLAGWMGAGQDAAKCWEVEDGLLKCTGAKGPWLRSAEQVDDFNLRLEYRLKDGGNSGVYVRVPENGNHHGKDAGVEVQILDDHAERYKKLKDYQYSASVYKIAPADPRVSRPAGAWNTLEIDCRGDAYLVTHNGTVVVTANLKSHPGLGERLKKGYLGLQNHSEEVWFRDIRLGPSTRADQAEASESTNP
ncbi:MAG: DUF1080 domain-containing protein, partial [Pirellulaceae bacterium]|nr:DUF1080 domain-containing protein [Pirellulaceae bacterium]